MREIENVLLTYRKNKKMIKDFLSKTNNKSDKYVLGELYFCLLTPRSKAVRCRKIVNEMKSKNLLFNPNKGNIKKLMSKFGYALTNKSEYIIIASKNFNEIKNNLTREWLEKNVKGLGMKESSHFLRNVGYKGLGIIDVHVQRFLKKVGLFDREVGAVTKKQYLELEKKFFDLSKKLKIPSEELDIAIWLYQSGEKEFYG
ncbi:hypothetical protein KY342_00055 [Candidatus Woesearchaeota archaeon]|nr:hypothetical protein [Candidatus Woesearchaeota archaeon]